VGAIAPGTRRVTICSQRGGSSRATLAMELCASCHGLVLLAGIGATCCDPNHNTVRKADHRSLHNLPGFEIGPSFRRTGTNRFLLVRLWKRVPIRSLHQAGWQERVVQLTHHPATFLALLVTRWPIIAFIASRRWLQPESTLSPRWEVRSAKLANITRLELGTDCCELVGGRQVAGIPQRESPQRMRTRPLNTSAFNLVNVEIHRRTCPA